MGRKKKEFQELEIRTLGFVELELKPPEQVKEPPSIQLNVEVLMIDPNAKPGFKSLADEAEVTDFQTSAKETWSNFKANQKCSVVYVVLGANLPFRVFEEDEATRGIILETGVVHFDKKPVVIRPWSTDIDSMNVVKSVPVWIRLNGLTLQYWGKNTLSALVSTIGNPIMIDKITRDGSMIRFARVLVDMPINEKPPNSISFVNEKNQLMEQSVKFECLPTSCATSGVLGHNISSCAKEKGNSMKPQLDMPNKDILTTFVNAFEALLEPLKLTAPLPLTDGVV
uniref:DUF4283 domain-containing protein n=1 Tax=Cannabis sativa TaxID=3483 RepID=A0A803PLP2_CANSA